MLDVGGGARRDTGHPVKLELQVNNKYFFLKEEVAFFEKSVFVFIYLAMLGLSCG